MNGVKSDSKDAQTPKTDASDPTAKLPVAGKDHEGEPILEDIAVVLRHARFGAWKPVRVVDPPGDTEGLKVFSKEDGFGQLGRAERVRLFLSG